ncbi:hypothetical protein WN944_003249 [Citrus x changshan-huyou]|uniref:Uncharacterized protein n=1 Tax=Citrus x changshan-huyou TaxID=2935761 RepID=A0AAP0QKZ0_9ROSI
MSNTAMKLRNILVKIANLLWMSLTSCVLLNMEKARKASVLSSCRFINYFSGYVNVIVKTKDEF